jgi:hypothetical protein
MRHADHCLLGDLPGVGTAEGRGDVASDPHSALGRFRDHRAKGLQGGFDGHPDVVLGERIGGGSEDGDGIRPGRHRA